MMSAITELREAVKSVPEMKPTSCSCDTCKSMCKTPCIGTPEEMVALHKKYPDKIAMTMYAPWLVFGIPPITLLAPIKTENGCVFRTADGLCGLHDSGEKPIEGKLSSCTHPPAVGTALPMWVAAQWIPYQKYMKR